MTERTTICMYIGIVARSTQLQNAPKVAARILQIVSTKGTTNCNTHCTIEAAFETGPRDLRVDIQAILIM